MPRARQELGPGPRCGRGPVACSYNSFVNGDERIESWEHRCRDCAFRETQATRGPAADAADSTCPYCGRSSPQVGATPS